MSAVRFSCVKYKSTRKIKHLEKVNTLKLNICARRPSNDDLLLVIWRAHLTTAILILPTLIYRHDGDNVTRQRGDNVPRGWQPGHAHRLGTKTFSVPFFVFGAKFAEIGASTRTNHATWRVGRKIKGKECCIHRVLGIMIVSGSLCLFHGMWGYSQNFSFPYKSYQFVVSFQATGPNRPLLLSNVVLCSYRQ